MVDPTLTWTIIGTTLGLLFPILAVRVFVGGPDKSHEWTCTTCKSRGSTKNWRPKYCLTCGDTKGFQTRRFP